MRLLPCFLLLSLWYASDAKKSSLHCVEFLCARKNYLLFTIRSGTGMSPIDEFDNESYRAARPHPEKGSNVIPDLFRSSFLDNLPEALQQTGSNRIVTEMRKYGVPVARATFDVTWNVDQLTSHNWFTANRLVHTYPYWTGNSANNFVDMSIQGHRHEKNQRSFYIHHSHGGCTVDKGLMGIKETADGGCPWETQGGKAPVMFYARKEGAYHGQEPVVGYADLFLVYLTRE